MADCLCKKRNDGHFCPQYHQILRYPIIDGDLITADPLQKIMNGDVKPDLGFYYHEDSHDEACFQKRLISSLFIGLKSNFNFENYERVTV